MIRVAHIILKVLPKLYVSSYPPKIVPPCVTLYPNYSSYPPCLQEQPIFYPVLNETYATQIARDWNANYNRPKIGHITRFHVRTDYLAHFEIHSAGSVIHQEYWIPAERLDEFNWNIVGLIEVIAENRG